MADFKADVLSWLRKIDPGAVEVLDVTAFGSDWAGSTEGGFHSEADVSIRYRRSDTSTRYREIAGEELGDLWKWVITEWDGR